jgi:hypothetical protein
LPTACSRRSFALELARYMYPPLAC